MAGQGRWRLATDRGASPQGCIGRGDRLANPARCAAVLRSTSLATPVSPCRHAPRPRLPPVAGAPEALTGLALEGGDEGAGQMRVAAR